MGDGVRTMEVIRSSQFANQYGGLSLALCDDENEYLEMETALDPVYFGPLSAEEINAFNILCEVKEV